MADSILDRGSGPLPEPNPPWLAAGAGRSVGLFDWDLIADKICWSAVGETGPASYNPAGISFSCWRQQILAEDADEIERSVEAARLIKPASLAMQFRIRQPDGATRQIEGNTRCIYGPSGNLVRLVGATVDMNERTESEMAVIGREAQLQMILDTVPTAMVVIDEHGIIEHFSAAAERMFGYRADEVAGSNVARLMPDSLGMRHNSFLTHYLDTGERRVIGKHRSLTGRRRDGTEFPIELSVGEAMVGERRIFTGFVRDLSERLAAEHAAADLRAELTQVSRMAAMGELAANLAHELNQPLSATANFLAAVQLLLNDETAHDRVSEFVTMANEQIQRAGDIIRNIRGFLAHREVEVGIEQIEKTIRDGVALVMVGSVQMEVGIRYSFEQASPFMMADRIQIQQVLVNLLRNAIEALQSVPRERRQIEIAVRPAELRMVEISVSDNGPGIDEVVLDRLFTPISSTKGRDGMGLGLSICRRIVDAHGGVMTAENRAGGGATFRFTVPVGTTSEEFMIGS